MDRVNFFPDGMVERGVELSSIIWANYYSNPEIYNKLTLKIDEYNELCGLIDNLDSNPSMMIVNDHKYIYDFVKKLGYTDFEIWNVDFHSDVYNMGEEVNCGNWGNKLLSEYKNSKIVWVHDEEEFEYPCELSPEEESRFYIADYSEMLIQEYDAIFICKSNGFSPPHLDMYFDGLVECIDYSGLPYLKSGGLEDRMPRVEKRVQENKSVLRKLEELNNQELVNDAKVVKLDKVIDRQVKW